jgi:hypothetical protein
VCMCVMCMCVFLSCACVCHVHVCMGAYMHYSLTDRCTKLSVLPSDEGHFFFDDAAHGCAHIVLLESHGLLEVSLVYV